MAAARSGREKFWARAAGSTTNRRLYFCRASSACARETGRADRVFQCGLDFSRTESRPVPFPTSNTSKYTNYWLKSARSTARSPRPGRRPGPPPVTDTTARWCSAGIKNTILETLPSVMASGERWCRNVRTSVTKLICIIQQRKKFISQLIVSESNRFSTLASTWLTPVDDHVDTTRTTMRSSVLFSLPLFQLVIVRLHNSRCNFVN